MSAPALLPSQVARALALPGEVRHRRRALHFLKPQSVSRGAMCVARAAYEPECALDLLFLGSTRARVKGCCRLNRNTQMVQLIYFREVNKTCKLPINSTHIL